MGRASTRDPWVVESWLRCLHDYRLDPTRACEAYILPETDLRSHRQQSEELISIARSGLEALYQQIEKTTGRRYQADSGMLWSDD